MRIQITIVLAALLSTSTVFIVAAGSAEPEWWEGTFVKEASGGCFLSNPTIKTYSSKRIDEHGVGYGCDIMRSQKIKNTDGVILDYACNLDDEAPSNVDERSILLKLNYGFYKYPENQAYTRCTPPPKGFEPDECGDGLTIEYKSQDNNDGNYQKLYFIEQHHQGDVVIENYDSYKLTWYAKGKTDCLNELRTCRLTFPTFTKEVIGEYSTNMVNSKMILSFPSFLQRTMAAGDEDIKSGSEFGGLKATFHKDFEPKQKKIILPVNEYTSDGCGWPISVERPK